MVVICDSILSIQITYKCSWNLNSRYVMALVYFKYSDDADKEQKL
jgi:hypothetical protein